MIRTPCALALSFLVGACSTTASSEPPSSTAETSGLFEVEVDHEKGMLALILPPPDADGVVGEYLHVATLTVGMGSNPVGLDRGGATETQLVRFRRMGGRLMVEVPNQAYRASSADLAERRAAVESFARSVVWSGELELRDDGRLRVDFTDFFVRDGVGAARTLARSGEGNWSLDADRSALDTHELRVFPDNLEVDAWLTFEGSSPGREARATVPVPSALTLIQHHSFVRLPDAGYATRDHDPRAGAFEVAYLASSTALDEPVERRHAVRHRLQRADAADASSPVLEPIVYYVDRGAPEPIRSALMEGASWWGEAFAAAGFPDAFRVELLPEGVHPLDVRYNVIQWVHRATRGWSYGGGVIDPRTGEMLKGHVRLGSLRIRQDRLLFEGLVGVENTGKGTPDDPVELALARIRQLAAHEVGHTLGLSHNFAASTYGGRASVMDYPAPLVTVGADGALDLSDAYAVGMGEWDVQAIRWLYTQFPAEVDEARALDAIVAEGIEQGRIYLSDQDARPAGAAEPRANLWDNGTEAVEGLRVALEVRAVALEGFGERNLAAGSPRSRLEAVLAPLYLHHRYALAAAAKTIGGATYAYALVGDANQNVERVPAEAQRAGLTLVASLLEPRHYLLSEELVARLAPLEPGVAGGERFEGRSAPLFDSLAAAGSASALVVDELLQRERCARLVQQHAADASLPALEDVLAAGTRAAFLEGNEADPRSWETARLIQTLWVERLLELAVDARAASGVRTRVEQHLQPLASAIVSARSIDNDLARQQGFDAMIGRISRFRNRALEDLSMPTEPEQPPPGSPIGLGGELCGCNSGG